MPQNYQFVETLIQLRQHYQLLNEDAERDSNHATEQLNHINALLIDQLRGNQQFVDSLLELRSHYQALHAQHQQKANSAKEQLHHVNALLADQAVLQHSQSISTHAATLEQLALSGAITDNGKELQKQSLLVAQKPETPEISDQQITSDVSQGVGDGAIALGSEESPQQDLEMAESPETPQMSEPEIHSEPSQVEQQPEPELPMESTDIIEDFPKRSPRHSAPLKTPLLPQYGHLTKSEAVEKLLQENEGKVLQVDFIIRALYGELPPGDITAEKSRLNETLRKGVAKGLWDKVPDEAGCYTADIKLIDKQVEPDDVENKKSQIRKPSSRATEGMLPRYQNLTFTDAVETVLGDHSGEIVTTDIMAQALFGELEGSALVEVKKKVGKILWSGANQGRWQSVPGQAGAYTLSL